MKTEQYSIERKQYAGKDFMKLTLPPPASCLYLHLLLTGPLVTMAGRRTGDPADVLLSESDGALIAKQERTLFKDLRLKKCSWLNDLCKEQGSPF